MMQQSWIPAWSVAILSLLVFVPFGWAVRGHFIGRGRLPKGMLVLSIASLAAFTSMVLVLMLRERPPVLAGVLLAASGMAAASGLFWWAIASTRSRRLNLAHSGASSDHVQSSGPYRWIRHPFYTSYMLFWMGTAVLAGSWQWLVALILVCWYGWLARGEEKQFARSPMAASYGAYRNRTGMILPRPGAMFRRPPC